MAEHHAPTTPPASFEPLGTEQELLATLKAHQSLNSDAAIGERVAASLLSKTPEGIAEIVGKFDADDEAGQGAVDYLFQAQESLSARLKCVETAIARLGTVGERMHGDGR